MSGLAVALTTVTLAVTVLSAGPAQAQERAALEPALVEGRGVTVRSVAGRLN
jgi:hypothetical protein